MTRNPLLPVLAGSRAVLVGRDVPEPDADHGFGRGWESAELATMRLGQVLVSPVQQAFEMTSVAELVGDPSPDEVIEAMRWAAVVVSDTLLFSYSATGPIGDRSELATVAQIMHDSAAARLVVLLDCSDFASLVPLFLKPDAVDPDRVSLLAGERHMLLSSEIDPLTSNLAEVIATGVRGGPEVLDLVSLRDAVRARYTELRVQVENEWIPGEKSLFCYAGQRVALAVNPALPPSGEVPRRREPRPSVGPLRKTTYVTDDFVRNAARVLIEAIRAAAPASWTPEEGAEPEIAVTEPAAETEVPGRYVLVIPANRRLKVLHRGGGLPWTSAWTEPCYEPRDAEQDELVVRQLHVAGAFPAAGFSATAAVHVRFPSRGWGVGIKLRALIAMRVPGWTATAGGDSARVRWRAEDPEAPGRSISIEQEPGDEGGDVTMIGTTALGVEQRIMLPGELTKAMSYMDVSAVAEAFEAMTVMGVLPVETQWDVAGRPQRERGESVL